MLVVSDHERSIFTMIIYLNDDFTGGNTYFHARHEKQLPFIASNLEATRVASVKPKTGSCLLFNHDILHEGEQVLQGNKYIIRVELMFERISTTHSMYVQQLHNNPHVMLAHQLYHEADEWIVKGDTKKATEVYLKALSMFVADPSVKDTVGLNGLPNEMILHVMSFLDYKDLLLSCAVLNKKYAFFAIL